MQFNIPQFIDVEDKVIGPLTVKQFLWLLTGSVAIFFIYMFTDLSLFIILASPVALIFLALAFYKINGRSFIVFVGAVLYHFIRPKFFLWQRQVELKDIAIERTEDEKKIESMKEKERKEYQKMHRQKQISESNLERLAKALDTEGVIPGARIELIE